MHNDLELKLSVTLRITAVDMEGVLILLDELKRQLQEEEPIAGIFGGLMGECVFSVDPLARAVEQQDEAVGKGRKSLLKTSVPKIN